MLGILHVYFPVYHALYGFLLALRKNVFETAPGMN